MGSRFSSPLMLKGVHFAVIVLVALVAWPAESKSNNPFDQLKGYWAGGGTITPIAGKPEKVSCRVTYSVEGSKVSQNIRCAGTDYKFTTGAKLTYTSGRITGSWTEQNYDADGGVTGTASGSSVNANISGQKFSGRMSISIKGRTHHISIVQLDQKSGGYRPVASVSLRR